MASNVVTHQIEIRRQFSRTPVEESLVGHISSLVKGFQGKYKLDLEPASGESRYYAPVGMYPCDISINFSFTGPDHQPDDIEWQTTMASFVTKLSQIKTGRSADTKYRLHRVDGAEFKPMDPREMLAARVAKMEGMVEYADIDMPSPEMLKVGMEGLFDLDAQIEMVTDALQRAIEQSFGYRDHQLLIGDPGCGKSDTLMRIATMLQAMGFGSAVYKVDGTAMTSAGLIDDLNDMPVMPRIMMVEEIDKADNQAVSMLLGLMDKHGEIRKTTYRDKIAKDARMLVFATANSFDKIARMQEGALLSRFGNPVQYHRPDDKGLRRILDRELNDAELAMCCKPILTTDKKGNEVRNACGSCKECKRRAAWINNTLEWCNAWHGKLMIDTKDPRFVISMCISGQDKLISGRYQRNLEATSIMRQEVTDFN